MEKVKVRVPKEGRGVGGASHPPRVGDNLKGMADRKVPGGGG